MKEFTFLKPFALITLAFLCINQNIIGQEAFVSEEVPSLVTKKIEHKTRKTIDFLKKGNTKFKNQQYEVARDLAVDARKYCDDFKSLNLLGAINASLEYYGTAESLLERGLDYGMSEDLNLDTLHFNLAGLHLQNKEYHDAINTINNIESPEAFTQLPYYKGVAEYELGNVEFARHLLTTAVEIDPKNADAHYYLGLANYDNGNFIESATHLNYAVRLEKGILSYLIAAGNANEKVDADKVALSCFNLAYHKDPYDVNALLGVGNMNSKLGNYNKANIFFNKVLEVNKKSYAAYYGLANVQYNLKNYEEAATLYDKTIKLNPDFAGAYTGLGNINCHQGNYYDAIQNYTQSIWLNNSNPVPYEGRAIANFRTCNYAQALNDFDRCLDLSKDYLFSYDAYISKGFAQYSTGAFEEAIASFEQAILLGPEKATGYDGLGCVFFALEKFNKSVANFNKAIELDPDNAAMYTNRGNALYRIMAYDEALNDFNVAINLNPQNEHAFNGRGICLHQGENYVAAIEAFEKGIDIAPSNYDLHRNLGISRGLYVKELRDAGKTEEATSQFDLMLKDHNSAQAFGMDSAGYLINLGYLHIVFEEYDKAMDYFNRVEHPAAAMFAENNKGVVLAMRENGKNLSAAYEFFNEAVEKDMNQKYPNPRVNRALIAQELGRSISGDRQTADFISTKEFNKILHKDKYYSTYFYYAIMRYLPPAIEHTFENEIIAEMPASNPNNIKYLVYPSDETCYKYIPSKIKTRNLRNVNKSKVNHAICPKHF